MVLNPNQIEIVGTFRSLKLKLLPKGEKRSAATLTVSGGRGGSVADG